MFLRVATLIIAGTSVTIALVSVAPDAHADQDQDFLDMVHAHGISVDNDTLIKYAHQFCAMPTGLLPSRPDLYRQGVTLPEQFYCIKEAASRVYCKKMIAMPPTK
jgi:hypothetical protein